MGIFLKEKIKYGQILTVSVDKIDANPNQPRKYFDDKELELVSAHFAKNLLKEIDG